MENSKSNLSFKDKHHNGILRGHVRVMLEDPDTKERSLWYENDNIIPISGTDVFLMKAFGLHLDSIHGGQYEDVGQDTNLVIPDLNDQNVMNIGIDPSDYDVMAEDIASNYIIQGFMVGNGGSEEDAISSKNTDYSFINLRNPIPFQQADYQGLPSTIANSYLGDYRQPNQTYHNYFIKKFDSRPHIVHSWWKEDQEWDYVDPVKQSDLGPYAQTDPRSNRIESYVEAEMSINIKNNDCKGYFSNGVGQNQTAEINELGLVAFDTRRGTRGELDVLYNTQVKKLIDLVFRYSDSTRYTQTEVDEAKYIADEILADATLTSISTQSNIVAFVDAVRDISNWGSSPDWTATQDILSNESNINVTAYYKRGGDFAYATDEFLEDIDEVSGLSYDEANRIKLVTYYTFNSIPLKENWNIIINYRIYAN